MLVPEIDLHLAGDNPLSGELIHWSPPPVARVVLWGGPLDRPGPPGTAFPQWRQPQARASRPAGGPTADQGSAPQLLRTHSPVTAAGCESRASTSTRHRRWIWP